MTTTYTDAYDYKTIERESSHEDSEYLVYGHDEYAKPSVNEGMPRRTYLGSYDTAQEAAAAHPDADNHEGSTKHEYNYSECPPSWFDASDAGETW